MKNKIYNCRNSKPELVLVVHKKEAAPSGTASVLSLSRFAYIIVL